MGVPLHSLFFLLLMGIVCSAAVAQGRFRMVTYNCENLFDTVHDAGKEDTAFLPSSLRQWNSRRFWQKLRHLSKAVIACGEGLLPDVVALCEVENDSCLHALTKRSSLRRAGYNYVMTTSPDRRGIDVALLYQPGTFRLLARRSCRIPSSVAGEGRQTRDILHVTGLVRTMDTLDIFVCHLPSRRSGRKGSEPFRLSVAAFLKKTADSVVMSRRLPRVILAGDFNDEPRDRSLRLFSPGFRVLTDGARGTFHPREVSGTYYYKGCWSRLDHLLVNKEWLDCRSGFRPVSPATARILDFPFFLEENRTHAARMPRSFYRGYRYNGGYSDHLPVCIDFVYE